MTAAARVDSLDAPADIAAEVADSIAEFLTAKSAEFRAISPDTAEIGEALLDFTRGGKRIRPILLWWGHQLAQGDRIAGDRTAGDRTAGDRDGGSAERPSDSESRRGLAEAAASLELLHAAALIHDDVIDHSDTRRGDPALHRRFEALHSRLGYHGDEESFGVAAAIVIGDICLALSEELFESAQNRLGASWRAQAVRAQMRRDVMVGQFLDVRAEVIPLSDERIGPRAWEVLSFKSAKYSVEQPLLLGAALGGASEDQLAALSRFGLPLGQAFQLRDDVLGVVGDPVATGKPAGDDIREGKRTVLIAESLARLSPAQTRVLSERLGDGGLSDAEVAETVAMLIGSGGLAAVEEIIAGKHEEALAELRRWSGAPDSAPLLRESGRAPLPDALPEGAAADGPFDGAPGIRLGESAAQMLTDFADRLSYREH